MLTVRYDEDDEPRDPGLTFSTLDSQLAKRIDYVFYRGSAVRALACKTIATFPAKMEWASEVPLSDHLGLLLHFSL